MRSESTSKGSVAPFLLLAGLMAIGGGLTAQGSGKPDPAFTDYSTLVSDTPPTNAAPAKAADGTNKTVKARAPQATNAAPAATKSPAKAPPAVVIATNATKRADSEFIDLGTLPTLKQSDDEAMETALSRPGKAPTPLPIRLKEEKPPPQTQASSPRTAAVPAPAVAVTAAPAPAPGTNPVEHPRDDAYRLRAGDKIRFQVVEDRDPPRSLVVTDSGEVEAPYIGRVAAADMTCQQLAAELKADLEKDYYYRATVMIGLESVSRHFGRVYVWGQVRNRGPVDFGPNGHLMASRAIQLAGGFADGANRKKVKVVRDGADGGSRQSFELNMVEIMDEGKTERDVPLQPDDFVIVP